MYFLSQVTREPATLIALIAVKPDYPRRAPVFCLNLHWDGEHNVHNSENIRVTQIDNSRYFWREIQIQ